MNTSGLSIADAERLSIVADIIASYATGKPVVKDMFVVFPDKLDAELTSLIENNNLGDCTQSLLLRLSVADTSVIPVPGTDEVKPDSACRLSALLPYFVAVINDAPLLEKRGYASLLALFLSRLVVTPGQCVGGILFPRIYVHLSTLPELSFIHLYDTVSVVPESLDIGLALLCGMSKGTALPNIDLAVTLSGQDGVLLDGGDVYHYLLNPDTTDLIIERVKTVVVKHPASPEEKAVLIDEFASQGLVLFGDLVREVTGGSFESELIAKFVLRRLADVAADILNNNWNIVRCEGFVDIYPWLVQCYSQVNDFTSK